jgi:two-component system, chemotaxis family, response regulator Rcp1
MLDVLLVEDNVGDVRLMQEAFRSSKSRINLHVTYDGVEAMAFLRHEGVYASAPRPHLILLDLNLPKMDGREVLAKIKTDNAFKVITTIVLTSCASDADVHYSYANCANCFVRKPHNWATYEHIVKGINNLWFELVRFPATP